MRTCTYWAMFQKTHGELFQYEPAAKAAGGGGAGAITFCHKVKMYPLSDPAVIVGVCIAGAKYYKADDLNCSVVMRPARI